MDQFGEVKVATSYQIMIKGTKQRCWIYHLMKRKYFKNRLHACCGFFQRPVIHSKYDTFRQNSIKQLCDITLSGAQNVLKMF